MVVELIDHMGSDLSVANAARVSFEKSSDWVVEYDAELEETFYSLSGRDAKLIKYLAKHNHWTPFGHCYATFRIKAPIFVARQLGKHQVGLVWNEVSRRYVDSDPEFYTPKKWRKRADNVKQGSSESIVPRKLLELPDGPYFTPEDAYELCVEMYNMLLAKDVCPEQARMVLPQSMLTEWWWSGSLAAFARVCKLRLDPHTQRETQQVAERISEELAQIFPVSWEALMET